MPSFIVVALKMIHNFIFCPPISGRQHLRLVDPLNAFDGLHSQDPFKFRWWASKCSSVDQGHPDLPFPRDLDGATAKAAGSIVKFHPSCSSCPSWSPLPAPEHWKKELIDRYRSVRRFLPKLPPSNCKQRLLANRLRMPCNF
jgi:hypothetical protein